jgi:Fur family ferric uptake transcriptional regulator
MDRKLRNTRPRRIILEELKKVTSHPTADEIYNKVRARLPRVSLGTVYRNLEIMAGSGLVMKLEIAGTQRRYDGTPEQHYHIRCEVCGKVDDIQIKPINIDREIRGATPYEISGHSLEFKGKCPACKGKKSKPAAS